MSYMQPPPPAHTPPPRRRAALYVALTALAAVAAFFGAGAVGQSLNDDPDPAACKAAMKRDFDHAIAAGSTSKPNTRPSECDGIDDKTAQRIAAEIVQEELGKG